MRCEGKEKERVQGAEESVNRRQYRIATMVQGKKIKIFKNRSSVLAFPPQKAVVLLLQIPPCSVKAIDKYLECLPFPSKITNCDLRNAPSFKVN